MKIYRDYLLPRLTDCALSAGWLNKLRGKTLAAARGRGLEVGFGSGLNLPHLPQAVTSLVALEPSKAAFSLAADRIRSAAFPVEHICAACEDATLPAGDFDFAATTCTLCTVGDPRTALCKVREALKPGGRFYFLEHGRSPNRLVGRLQDFLTPLQACLFGGCTANRPIDKLLEGAGFRIVSLDRSGPPGLGLFYSMYRGVAVPA